MRLREAARIAPAPWWAGGLIAVACALPIGAARAETAGVPAAVRLGPGSELWLEGTSTVHDYESRTSQLKLTLVRDAAAQDPADVAALERWLRSGGLRGLDLLVPIATMHSKRGEGLDKNLRKALRASEHPEITFHLTGSRLGAASGDTLALSANGVPRVAGREAPITVAGRLWRGEVGMWLAGDHGLLMSEYGVKPPTMMMGTLRVRDPVSVHFKLLLTPGQAPVDQGAVPQH